MELYLSRLLNTEKKRETTSDPLTHPKVRVPEVTKESYKEIIELQ